MSRPVRVRLLTIAAQQLWDGRKVQGKGFIPGARHFQAGVDAVAVAAAREVPEAFAQGAGIRRSLESAATAVAAWRRGVDGFVEAELALPGGWRGRDWASAQRELRAWRAELWQLAGVVVAFDRAAAVTVSATEAAKKRGVFNPYHGCIREVGGQIRTVIVAGHASGVWARDAARAVAADG